MNLFFQINELKSTRLDVFITKLLSDNSHKLSRAAVQSLIENNLIKINQQIITKPSTKLSGSITVEMFLPDIKFEETEMLPSNEVQFSVEYEDEDIAIINKPSGLSVHKGAGSANTLTLVNGLLNYFGEHLSNIDPSRPGIVHRIDKDTSGLMMIAKTNTAHLLLTNAFKARKIIKKYTAFSWGVPSGRSFLIDNFIGRNKKNRQKMSIVDGADESAKRAISHFKILDSYKNIASKIECSIETGRTHQIRVHLSHNGHPIIGDPLYTRKRIIAGEEYFFDTFKRQALHSSYIGFTHPLTKEWCEFSSDMPNDMHELQSILLKLK